MLSFFLTLLGIGTAYNNGVGQVPAMGWNTWCSVAQCVVDICNQWEVLDTAKAMKTNGMYDHGYTRINLDDCWEACNRSATGEIQSDPNRFPDGIKYLADKLHALGFKFGLYTSAGSATCSAGMRNCGNNGSAKPPGSYNHYTQDSNTFASWGVDYVKIDWCGNDLYNSTKQHTEFSNAINATGRPIWIELCHGYSYPPPPYVAKVSNSWRISGDHQDTWSTTSSIIQLSANITQMSGEYNWAYNDFLMTGGQGCGGNSNPNLTYPHCPGQTDIEYITEFSMWTIVNSPLIVATDVRNFTDIQRKILLNKDIIAINQMSKYAAGNIVSSQSRDCDLSVYNACQVWSKQIGENSSAIVLYNAGNNSHDITFEFSAIPGLLWTSSTKLDLKDLWEQTDYGKFTGQYTGEQIPSHGVMFLVARE